jgi:MFS family permease
MWQSALFATLVLQMASAFLAFLLPTLAPVLSDALGAGDSLIGYLSAINTIGSIVFLLMGTPLIRRAGPIRSLQLGLLLGAAGVLMLLAPFLPFVILGSFLLGLGYGPSAPAGSDILHRFSPIRHRNLIFSIKQAGVPLSGAAAGLVLPALYHAGGWTAVIFVALAVIAGTIGAVQPMRSMIDDRRAMAPSLRLSQFVSVTNLLLPLRALASSPGLVRLSAAGACFAISQGCWFAFLVTYLAEGLGFSLTQAGAIFATMQLAGIFGRILLGWISDRLNSGLMVLRLVALASAASSATLAMARPEWSFSGLCLLAGISGITVASWNGVQLAEIAKRAPPTGVTASAAGATVLIFSGYFGGPLAFALLLEVSGSFQTAFFATAAIPLAALLILSGAAVRRTDQRRSATRI